MINMELAAKYQLDVDEIAEIKDLHRVRDALHTAISTAVACGKTKLSYSIAQLLPDLELELQELWGFRKDINHYKFWNVDGCSCPKIDNNRAHPFGPYVFSLNCPLHHRQ